MCEFCNGNLDTQKPLEGRNEVPDTPILTVITYAKALSVIEVDARARETLFHINYCPNCGRKL